MVCFKACDPARVEVISGSKFIKKVLGFSSPQMRPQTVET